jgi:hypothetical protein
MKNLLFVIAICTCTISFAQSLSPEVIASAGGYASAGGISLSYTVGEMAMVETFTSSNTILTQGFHQPEQNITRILEAEQTDFGSFAVYPNPATTEVFFGYEFPQEGRIEVTLYNNLGQVVQNVFTDNEYSSGKSINAFNCSLLAAGNYVMQANFAGNEGKKQVIAKKLQIITH